MCTYTILNIVLVQNNANVQAYKGKRTNKAKRGQNKL